MAKKKEINPAELPVEEKLKNLYQLQTMLSEIDKIRILRGELPLEVEDLEDEIEGLKTRIENITEEVMQIRSRINENKSKIEIANNKLNEYKSQIDNVRNNREYDALNKEIEYNELEVAQCQKHIKDAQVAEKAKEELIEQSKKTLDERNQDLEVDRKSTRLNSSHSV